MAGLAFLFFAAIYLAFSFMVIKGLTNWAKKRGRRSWLWGTVGFLVMYNILFWEFIPTYIVYKYYIYTKSGCWIYKTPEQWAKENPEALKTLTRSTNLRETRLPDNSGYILNSRMVDKNINHRNPIVPVVAREGIILDVKNNTVLARIIVIYSGYTGAMGYFKAYNHRAYIDRAGAHKFLTIRDEFKSMARVIE